MQFTLHDLLSCDRESCSCLEFKLQDWSMTGRHTLHNVSTVPLCLAVVVTDSSEILSLLEIWESDSLSYLLHFTKIIYYVLKKVLNWTWWNPDIKQSEVKQLPLNDWTLILIIHNRYFSLISLVTFSNSHRTITHSRPQPLPSTAVPPLTSTLHHSSTEPRLRHQENSGKV